MTASNILLNAQTAKQLGLRGTKIPYEKCWIGGAAKNVCRTTTQPKFRKPIQANGFLTALVAAQSNCTRGQTTQDLANAKAGNVEIVQQKAKMLGLETKGGYTIDLENLLITGALGGTLTSSSLLSATMANAHLQDGI